MIPAQRWATRVASTPSRSLQEPVQCGLNRRRCLLPIGVLGVHIGHASATQGHSPVWCGSVVVEAVIGVGGPGDDGVLQRFGCEHLTPHRIHDLRRARAPSAGISPSQAITAMGAWAVRPPGSVSVQPLASGCYRGHGTVLVDGRPAAAAVRASARTHSAGSSAPSASTTAARRYQRLSRSGSASRSIRQRMPASDMAVTAPVSASTSSSPASHTLPVVRTVSAAPAALREASASRSWPTRSAGAASTAVSSPTRSIRRVESQRGTGGGKSAVSSAGSRGHLAPSSTATFSPAVASLSAHAHPVTPAPTTSTSAARSPASGGIRRRFTLLLPQ